MEILRRPGPLMALCFFVLSWYLFAIKGNVIQSLELQALGAADETVKPYFDDSLRQPRFSEAGSARALRLPPPGGQGQPWLRFRPLKRPWGWVRLDLSGEDSVVDLGAMRVTSGTGNTITWQGPELHRLLRSPFNHNIRLEAHGDQVRLIATGPDPYVVTARRLPMGRLAWIALFPAALLSLYLGRAMNGLEWSALSGLLLPERGQVAAGHSVVQSLDGLRGLAALLVLAEHLHRNFLGAGHSGVLIFFALSGYLLARSLDAEHGLAMNGASLLRYGQRRLERILPMYYLYLFLVYGVTLRLNDLTPHLFFLRGDGHLWTIPQEMLFYALFPLLALLTRFLPWKGALPRLGVLVLVTVLLHRLAQDRSFYIIGMNGVRLSILLYVFCIGMLFALLHQVLRRHCAWMDTAPARHGAALVVIAFVAACVLLSNGRLLGNGRIYSMLHREYFALGAGLVIMLLCRHDTAFLPGRLLALPWLRSLGVVSYSFYLLHPLVIQFVKQFHITGVPYHAGVFFLTYVLACLTYAKVERPFLHRKEREGGQDPARIPALARTGPGLPFREPGRWNPGPAALRQGMGDGWRTAGGRGARERNPCRWGNGCPGPTGE